MYKNDFNFFFFYHIGGHSTFFALLNTFVHIVMYFYYMVSAMGPKYQKYIWWKKYLTSFQMVWLLSYNYLLQIKINYHLLWWSLIEIFSLYIFTATVRMHFRPPVPTVVPWMQLPKEFHGLDRPTRRHVLVPVLRLLQIQIHQWR